MRFQNEEYRRTSPRLKDYDYSADGAYFITVCTYNKIGLFGRVDNAAMVLNELGEIVSNEWLNTCNIRSNVQIDNYIVMPNHLHGIIFIRRGVMHYAPTREFKSPSQTIGAIVRGFKSSVTKQINIKRNTFGAFIWQRNFYEHVIRDDNDLNRVREYILTNPLKWPEDKYFIPDVNLT